MIRVNETEINVNYYPDDTQMIRIEPSVIKEAGKNIVTWNYETDEEMVTLLYVSDWLGDAKDILYMPYIPNARMDRVKNGNEVFTLKSFCKFINSLGYKKVCVLDPHSDVPVALLDNVECMQPDDLIHRTIERINDEDLVIFFPDSGAVKRYSGMIDKPYCYGVKNRDWKSGKILNLNVVDNGIDLKGKNVLIVDDICSRGGTFYYSAKQLQSCGANKIYLYITHCENTVEDGNLLHDNGLIERIYTTNSIYSLNHKKVEVLPV